MPTPATYTEDDIRASKNYPMDFLLPMGNIWDQPLSQWAHHDLERIRHGHACFRSAAALASIREPPPCARREAGGGVARRRGVVPRAGLPPRHPDRGCRTAEHHQARALQL